MSDENFVKVILLLIAIPFLAFASYLLDKQWTLNVAREAIAEHEARHADGGAP